MIRFTCPECGAALSAPDQAAGKAAPCKKCGETLRVPGEPPGPPPQATRIVQQPSSRRPPARTPPAPEDIAPGATRQTGGNASRGDAAQALGGTALLLGVVGLLLSFIPCAGWMIGLPLGGIGLALGLAGGVVAVCRKGRGIGYPIAGSAVSVLALLFGGFWAAKAVDDAGKRTTTDAPTTGAPAAPSTPTGPAPAQPSRPMFVGTWRDQKDGIEMVFKEDGGYELVADGKLQKLYWKVRDSSHIEFREHKIERENEEAGVLEYWMSDSDTMSARLAGRTEFGVMYRVKQP